MAPRDPIEVTIGDPNLTLRVPVDEHANRPIEACLRVRADELRAKRWIAEDQQDGWTQLDARLGGKRGLVDLLKEDDALRSNVLLDAIDSLRDVVRTPGGNNAGCAGRRPKAVCTGLPGRRQRHRESEQNSQASLSDSIRHENLHGSRTRLQVTPRARRQMRLTRARA